MGAEGGNCLVDDVLEEHLSWVTKGRSTTTASITFNRWLSLELAPTNKQVSERKGILCRFPGKGKPATVLKGKKRREPGPRSKRAGHAGGKPHQTRYVSPSGVESISRRRDSRGL